MTDVTLSSRSHGQRGRSRITGPQDGTPWTTQLQEDLRA
jgi:hypothetical protein